jgi:DNA mismatch endonuclease (patch repair protein)
MADTFTAAKRSEIMSRIGGKDTAPEVLVRRLLHGLGFRFRLHRKDLPGKPDIVLPRHKKLILVHGCFWHGHRDCPRAALPTTNVKFWRRKISKNIVRDRQVRKQLAELGWDVLVLWQCQLKDDAVLTDTLLSFLGGHCTEDINVASSLSSTRIRNSRSKRLPPEKPR